MTPKEFLDRARSFSGVTVTSIEIEKITLFVIEREYGDSVLKFILIDIPVLMPTSHVIAGCRDLGIPLSEFSLTISEV